MPFLEISLSYDKKFAIISITLKEHLKIGKSGNPSRKLTTGTPVHTVNVIDQEINLNLVRLSIVNIIYQEEKMHLVHLSIVNFIYLEENLNLVHLCKYYISGRKPACT